MPRAGATLSVSHAAISQQIRNLESFLNVPLLDRTARQAQLTDEGLALAKVLSGSFEAISAQVTQMTTKDTERPLVVSTTPSFAAHWLVP
jgi:LysR family glycine cleavage system transcriptional activator